MGSDRATIVAVRCSMLPDGPPQEKSYIGINATGFLFLDCRVDRCRTESPRDSPRFREDIAGAAAEVI